VSLILSSKILLFRPLVSKITNDFVLKSQAGHPLIHPKFCQATLSHNLRCKDKFDQILLKYTPSGPPNMKYLANFCPSQFQDIQGGPRGQKMGLIM